MKTYRPRLATAALLHGRRVARRLDPRRPRALPLAVPRADLDCQHITGNLTWGVGEVWAWFTLEPQRWSFRGNRARITPLESAGQALAALAPARVQWRSTPIPYPASAWARAMHKRTPRPLPDQSGGVGFAEWIGRQQTVLSGVGLAGKVDYLGVRLVDGLTTDDLDALREGRAAAGLTSRLRDRRNAVTEIVKAPGLGAKPSTAREIEYLFHRSAAPGVPAPAPTDHLGDCWEPADLRAFTDPVDYSPVPLDRTVRLDVDRDGAVTTSYCTAVSVGRTGGTHTPEDGLAPLWAHAEGAPFPVEFNATLDLLPGMDVLDGLMAAQVTGESQAEHYAVDHKRRVPDSIRRHTAAAERKVDEAEHQDNSNGVRYRGYITYLVYGPTADESLRRARALKARYARRADLHIATGQYAALRTFLPMQRPVDHGYLRQGPVRYFAFGQPHTTSAIGDGVGAYMGCTVSTARRPWLLDGHYATERLGRSGLMLVAAQPGGGKTTLAAHCVDSEVRRGHRTVVFDPSGPLRHMKRLAHLTADTHVLDLMLAPAGTLNPPALVPDPVRAAGMTDQEFVEAMGNAEAERIGLTTDVAEMLVAGDLAKIVGVKTLLSDAVAAAGGRRTMTLWDVIDVLRQWSAHTEQQVGNEIAGRLAEALTTTARFPLARLFFPPRNAGGNTAADAALADLYRATLTIITMPGLTIPPQNVERTEWSNTERLAFPLLHCATYFATRVVYGKPEKEPVTVYIDEAHILDRWASGRAFYTRLARDSRKWNAWIIAASQNPDADEAAFGDVDEYGVMACIGHLETPRAIAAGMRLLRVEEGHGYEATFPDMPIDTQVPYRDWLVRDAHGRVERVRHDFAAWYPELLEVVRTNPQQDGDGPDGYDLADFHAAAA